MEVDTCFSFCELVPNSMSVVHFLQVGDHPWVGGDHPWVGGDHPWDGR